MQNNVSMMESGRRTEPGHIMVQEKAITIDGTDPVMESQTVMGLASILFKAAVLSRIHKENTVPWMMDTVRMAGHVFSALNRVAVREHGFLQLI